MGESVSLSSAYSGTPTRAGYAFAGWNTAADGSGTHYDADGSITLDSTSVALYAEWTRTANLNVGSLGAASPSSVVFYYDADGKAYYNGSSTEQTGAVPVAFTPATDWTAVGWSSSDSSTTADALASGGVAPSDLSAAKTDFYAIASRSVSLSYADGGADSGTNTVPSAYSGMQTVNAGGTTSQSQATLETKPANLAKKGYAFGGWNIDGTTYQAGSVYTWADASATAAATATAVWNVITVTAPTAQSLPYTGSAQALVTGGSATDGTNSYTMEYSLSSSGSFSTSIPEATAIGSYPVYYRVVDSDGNVLVDPQSVTATINKGTPTVTAPTPVNSTYDGTNQALATAGSTTGGTLVYSLSENGSYSASIPTGKDAGSYTVWYKVQGDANFDNTAAASITATIAQREATLSWTNTNFTYDAAEHVPTATVSNLVSGDSCTVTVTGGQTNAGTYTATATGLDNANYTLPSAATQSFTIAPKPVGITWTGDSFEYDGSAQAPTAEATGVESGDSCTVSVSGAQTNAGGPYTATATTSNSNYTITSGAETHSFKITPKAIGLTWTDTTLTYNGSAQVPTATATGLVSGDSCTVTVGGEQTHPGIYTATATGVSNSNYTLPLVSSTSFSITAAALTVTAKDSTITYGDAPAGNGVTCSGFVGSDSESSLGGALTYTFSYNRYDDVGNSYTITPGGLTSADYNITFASGTLTVEQREVTLAWASPAQFDYDGNAHTWGLPTVGNTVNGDSLTAVWKTATAGAPDAYEATDVGSYAPVVESLADVGGAVKAENYKLPSNATGSWSINSPSTNSMTVSIAGWTYGKYDSTANAPSAAATFGTGATFTYWADAACTTPADGSDAANVPTNAGDYYVKGSVAGTSNYPAAEATCAFTVAKANITVTADDKQSVRSDGGTLKTLTCTIAGDLVASDQSALENDYIALTTDAELAKTGSYDITATWASGYTEHQNYDITFADGTYTVTRALANVSAAGYTGAYDGVADGEQISVAVTDAATGSAFGGTGTGAITVYYAESDFQSSLGLTSAQITALQGDDITTSAFQDAWSALQTALSGAATTSPVYKDAGTHTVYFMVVSDQVTPDVIFGSKDVVITKAPLTVTAGDKAIAYGDAADNGGFTATGYVNGETDSVLSGTATYAYGSYAVGSPVGNYPITVSGLAAGNYDITYVPGTLTVGKATLTLDWPSPDTFTYNGGVRTYGPPTLATPSSGDDVTVELNAGTGTATDAGSYTATVAGLTGTAAANYELDASAQLSHDWSITPADLTVKAKDKTITYGDAPANAGADFTTLLGSDTESSLGGTLTYSYSYVRYGDAGTYTITLAGLISSNYNISFEEGTLKVEPLELTLTWPADDEFDYTGSELTYGPPTLSGAVNGDDVSIGTYTGGAATDAGAHTAAVEALAGDKADNYTLPSNASHDWTIRGADNAAAVTMDGWTYGDEAASPQVTATFGADTATFAYFTDEGCAKAVAADALDANGVPRFAGTYWVKATVAAAANYNGAEATAKFTIAKRPLTVTALPQVVKVGGSIATGVSQVTASGLAANDALSAVTLSGTSTAKATASGKVTPSAVAVKDAGGTATTDSYDITYVPGTLVVAGASATENGKTIYVLVSDVWMTVAEAKALLAASDADEQLIELTGAAAFDNATGEALDVAVADRGDLAAKVGNYQVTFKTNPEVQATVHVINSGSGGGSDGDSDDDADGDDSDSDSDSDGSGSTGSGSSSGSSGSSATGASAGTGDRVPFAGLAFMAALAAAAALFAGRRAFVRPRGRHARR